MPGCAIDNCNYYTEICKAHGNTYHSFPKEGIIRKVWVGMCQRSDPYAPEMCSDRFSQSEYEQKMRGELLGYAPSEDLRKNTVLLNNTPVQSELNNEDDLAKFTYKLKIEEVEKDLVKMEEDSKEFEDDPTNAIAVLQEKIIRNLEPLNGNSVDYNLSLLVNCACFINDIHERAEGKD